MIIVEGCDGAGKTGFIRRLREDHGLVFEDGPKASTSVGGVSHHAEEDALADWVDAEFARWAELGYGPRVYDRHPLISEPIYGTLVRDALPRKFLTPWYASRARQLSKICLVVFVDPGWDEVKRCLGMNPQMPGVTRNAHRLWLAYRTLSHTWNGRSVRYDRSDARSLLSAVGQIEQHLENWRF